MSWATALITTAYYATYPITIVASFILAVLQALATPWVHVALYIFHICILLPWRFLLKFETLYIFLSIASVFGVSAGISLHFFSGYLHQLFDINAESEYGNEYHIDNHGSSSYQTNPSLFDKKYVTTQSTSGNKGLKGTVRERNEPYQAENRSQERMGMRGMGRLLGYTQERAVMYPAYVSESEHTGTQGKGIWENENGNEDRDGCGRVVKRESGREGLFSTMILEEEEDEDEDDQILSR
ncbi:hypothetical protein AJ78_03133 [Emergomyces pasteurianus Ep9510]|uniref:Uncharacterized protein n=1 Tax=Emergomyces pasteurianus Ep9510 TaxID=1447872 RepID=A0A1J9QLE6_9EURO|nr:hypothetical protein AJ78_03133 [Emergomyces pasteurianus Ep9510]